MMGAPKRRRPGCKRQVFFVRLASIFEGVVD
jgi:hypothetical protein